MEERVKRGALFGLIFAVVLAVAGGVAVAGYWGTRAAARPVSDTAKANVRFSEYSALVQADIWQLKEQSRRMLLSTDSPERVAEHLKIWQEQLARQVSRLDDLAAYATLEDEKALVNVLREDLAMYDAGFAKTMGKIQDGTLKTSKRFNRAKGAWIATSGS
jgi:hypothetical protein